MILIDVIWLMLFAACHIFVSVLPVVKVSRISDPGPRKFTIERSGAQLTSTMHREISAGSLRGSEIDRDPPPPILYFNH